MLFDFRLGLKNRSWFLVTALIMLGISPVLRAVALPDLWKERVKSAVAVEFYLETEIERRPTTTAGVVIDDQGTIILPGNVIPTYLPPSQFKDFKVYQPGESVNNFFKADYLGYDAFSGWHFIRIAGEGRRKFTPITAFVKPETPDAIVAQEVWGIALRGKDEDFAPFFAQNRVGFVTELPFRSAIATGYVAGPQLPVFDQDGNFIGLGLAGFGETFYQYSRTERGTPLLLVSGDEVRVFRLAADVVPAFSRVPKNPLSRPSPWMGVMGLQPVPAEVAKFLHLEDQSALVVSEVLEDGPSEKAGLKDRDIIVALDGKKLPRLHPAHVIVAWMEREIARRTPGTTMTLSVMRGTERVEINVSLVEEPRTLREADRNYFERLGFTVREFLFVDAVANRIKQSERSGVTTHFVKSNSPAAAAGLRAEDWIREIDGVEMKTFSDAIQKLDAIDKDTARSEFVMLISRGGDTAVIRVKLK